MLVAAAVAVAAGGCRSQKADRLDDNLTDIAPEGLAVDEVRSAGVTTDAPSEPDVTLELREAMTDAARYLAGACGPDGRFVYRIHLDPKRQPAPSYNELRHAGAIYALAQHQRHWPEPEVAAAIGRATSHLWTYSRPVSSQPSRLAIWSAKDDDAAKLGGAGLALVALGELKAIAPELVDRERVAQLAGFIHWMQKPDGSFYSKHFASRGRDDRWTSLYYPGEAALGLVKIGGEGNLRVAQRALMALARSRQGADRVPADHWALIATGALLATNSVPTDVAATLRGHARQVVDEILRESLLYRPGTLVEGSWRSGRTTPTATRLEGLIAALDYLNEPRDEDRRARMIAASERGVAFLLRARIAEGPHRGAMPRSIRWQSDEPSRRAGEVRIDYVQHALSAWIGWSLRQRRSQASKAGRLAK